MSDRGDWLGSECGTGGIDRQIDETAQHSEARTGEAPAGQRLTIVKTPALMVHPATVTGNVSEVLNPRSHLARLVDAVQRSRRFQAARRRRYELHLVQGERQ